MTPPETKELSLTITRDIAASPERVFNAWLDAKTLMQFMTNCSGIAMTRAETDPRVGGSFLIVMGGKGSDPVPHTGTYLAIRPHDHIAFTWVSPYSTAENSTVTLDFAASETGTLLTLKHSRFMSPENRDGHSAGWSMILDALGATPL